MEIALIQQAVTPGNKPTNYDRVTQLVEQALATSPKPDLIILPELWATGYALAELDRLAFLA